MFYYDSWIVELIVFVWLFLCVQVFTWRSAIVCGVIYFLHMINPLPKSSDFFTYWALMMLPVIYFTTKMGLTIMASFFFGYVTGNGALKDWVKRRLL